jgi:putative FmdB family regulatory protein
MWRKMKRDGVNMPIYEFVCKECAKNFEDLVLSSSQINEVICPVCGSGQVKKKMSTFASKPAQGSGSFSFKANAASCSTGSV